MSERPFLTVDCVVFHDNAVVLIRRAHEPFKGWYALPGGFVEVGETVEDACRRETRASGNKSKSGRSASETRPIKTVGLANSRTVSVPR